MLFEEVYGDGDAFGCLLGVVEVGDVVSVLSVDACRFVALFGHCVAYVVLVKIWPCLWWSSWSEWGFELLVFSRRAGSVPDPPPIAGECM